MEKFISIEIRSWKKDKDLSPATDVTWKDIIPLRWISKREIGFSPVIDIFEN